MPKVRKILGYFVELKLSLSTEIDFVVAIRRGLPSVPDPRSCIGSLSALGPVHDLIDSKQRRGAINQWVCYGRYRGFDITVFDI